MQRALLVQAGARVDLVDVAERLHRRSEARVLPGPVDMRGGSRDTPLDALDELHDCAGNYIPWAVQAAQLPPDAARRILELLLAAYVLLEEHVTTPLD